MGARRVLFRHPEVGSFFQAQPKLENPFTGDGFFRRNLQRLLPSQVYSEVAADLSRFGDRIVNELEPLSEECERSPPTLAQWDPWGKRVDQIATCDAWKRMKGIAAEEGIVALGYDAGLAEWARLTQFAKMYLYTPSSGLYSCPVAMTDGAAKTIQTMKIKSLDEAFKRLTSRNPKDFWTSGQWMTEKRGGSDVGSGTETVAIPIEGGVQSGGSRATHVLHGYKWFSSATDADVAITLARIADQDGNIKPGSGGLSMFFVKTRKEDGSLNNIHVMKLKNKLGTRQLPTGELLLDGTEAELVSDFGRGIPSISPMLTSTRLHNAVASVAGMRRILSLARDYSQRRVCFGVPIAQYPLHVNTMAEMELEIRGGLVLLLEAVKLLGLTENGKATDDETHLLRLFTPVLKLYTAKKGMGVMSEGLELFGGQGYIEDTGIPKHFRDAQVLPIWEGTTNILSLDLLRAIGKSKGQVLLALDRTMTRKLDEAVKAQPSLSSAAQIVKTNLGNLIQTLKEHLVQESAARLYAYSVAQSAIGALLIEHAASSQAVKSDVTCANRWAARLPDLTQQLRLLESEANDDSRELVFDSYEES